MRLALLLSALLLGAGCARDGAPDAPVLPDISSMVADDLAPPVAAKAMLSSVAITLGDPLRYTLIIDARPGYEPASPEFAENLGAFGVVDFGSEPPRLLPDGATRSSTWYDLDTYLTGEYTIPAQTITFSTDDPEVAEGTIASNEVTVTVASSFAEGEEPEDIRDIKDPWAVPLDKRVPAAIAGGTALAVAAVAAGALLRKRFHRLEGEEPEPAHLRALRELELLRSADLLSRGLLREFYYRLTDIVRRYIERRFGLHAPEETTEEFLAELAGSDALAEDHRRLLADFLSEADLVKYAAHAPAEEEVRRAVEAAGRLIEETAEPEDALPEIAAGEEG